MTQFINKSIIKAEIERLVKEYRLSNSAEAKYRCEAYGELLEYIDTLEVKDVDFEKEFDNYTKDILACDIQFEPFTHLHKCAKYFFELGLKAQKGE